MHVLDRVDRDADAPYLAERARRIGVDPHLRRQVECDGEPRLSLVEQQTESFVRLVRRAEAGVLAHRPEATAVHRRLHAARVRKGSGIREIPVI